MYNSSDWEGCEGSRLLCSSGGALAARSDAVDRRVEARTVLFSGLHEHCKHQHMCWVVDDQAWWCL